MHGPGAKERYAAIGTDAVTNSPEEFGAFIRKENERWSKLVRETGAQVD